jgi:hypothetical protein
MIAGLLENRLIELEEYVNSKNRTGLQIVELEIATKNDNFITGRSRYNALCGDCCYLLEDINIRPLASVHGCPNCKEHQFIEMINRIGSPYQASVNRFIIKHRAKMKIDKFVPFPKLKIEILDVDYQLIDGNTAGIKIGIRPSGKPIFGPLMTFTFSIKGLKYKISHRTYTQITRILISITKGTYNKKLDTFKI